MGADGKGRGPNGTAQIGVLENHEGGLAAEFEEDSLERCGGRGHDTPTSCRRTGEGHQIHPGIGCQLLTEGMVRRGNDVDDSGRDVGLFGDHAAEDCRTPRCVRRGLEHHGVPGRQCGAEFGQVDLVGDVPRSDGTDDSGGLAADPAMRRDTKWGRVAEVAFPLVGLGHRCHPTQSGYRFVELGGIGEGQRRPGLGHRQIPQLVGVADEGVLELAQARNPPGQVS